MAHRFARRPLPGRHANEVEPPLAACTGSGPTSGGFPSRVLIVLLMVGLALALWKLAGLLILAFGGVLLAILLRGLAGIVQRALHLRWWFAFALVLALLAGTALAMLFGLPALLFAVPIGVAARALVHDLYLEPELAQPEGAGGEQGVG